MTATLGLHEIPCQGYSVCVCVRVCVHCTRTHTHTHTQYAALKSLLHRAIEANTSKRSAHMTCRHAAGTAWCGASGPPCVPSEGGPRGGGGRYSNMYCYIQWPYTQQYCYHSGRTSLFNAGRHGLLLRALHSASPGVALMVCSACDKLMHRLCSDSTASAAGTRICTACSEAAKTHALRRSHRSRMMSDKAAAASAFTVPDPNPLPAAGVADETDSSSVNITSRSCLRHRLWWP